MGNNNSHHPSQNKRQKSQSLSSSAPTNITNSSATQIQQTLSPASNSAQRVSELTQGLQGSRVTPPTTIPSRPQPPLVHDSPFVGSPLMVSDKFADNQQPVPRAGALPSSSIRSYGEHRRFSSRTSSVGEESWAASSAAAFSAPMNSGRPPAQRSEDDLSLALGGMELESGSAATSEPASGLKTTPAPTVPADLSSAQDVLSAKTQSTPATNSGSTGSSGPASNSGPESKSELENRSGPTTSAPIQIKRQSSSGGLGSSMLQPSHEKSYRNSARIFHNFGPMASGSITVTKDEDGVIPIMISWAQGGGDVFVTGTFNNWKQKIRMSRSNADFTTVIDMPPGTHRFKFIVDDEWKCSEDLPIASDADGNLVNYLEVTDEAGVHQGDGLDELATMKDGRVSPPLLSSTPPDAYTTDIPSTPLNMQQKDPPHLPPHLEKVLLNSHTIAKDDRSVLPVPNHVTLNHMYACSIRDGVMAVGCTTRYRKKYITTVLYRPVFQ